METMNFEQMEQLALLKGLSIIEDIYISLSNGIETYTVYRVGCMATPPYSSLFNKSKVDRVISLLS